MVRVIQLTPQQSTLTINGVDFTQNLTEISGNWSGFSLSGFYIITGRIVLADVIGGSQTLDDRYNTNLCRGARIEFDVDGTPAPVIGTTYVESTQYDEVTGLQNIAFTCLLGLHNAKQTRNLGTCVKPGSSAEINGAVIDYLLQSGIDMADIAVSGIPGSIFQSTFSEAGGSAISSAGQLAAANGHALYQDRFGVITNFAFTPPFRANVFSGFVESTAQWERISDSTLPPDEVEVTFVEVQSKGSGQTRTQTSSDDPTTTEIIDGTTGDVIDESLKITQRETTDNTGIDREERKVSRDVRTERDTENYQRDVDAATSDTLNVSGGGSSRRNNKTTTETQIIEETYETSGGSVTISGAGSGADSIGSCYPEDNARLIRRETGTYEPREVVFAAYKAAAIQGYGGTPEQLRDAGSIEAASELASRLSIAQGVDRILVNLKTETWDYNLPTEKYDGTTQDTLFISEFLDGGEGNFSPSGPQFNLSGGGGANGAAASPGSVVYQSSEIGIVGNLLPFIGDPTFGTGTPANPTGPDTGNPKLFVNGVSQVIRSQTIIIWQLQKDGQTWKSAESVRQIGIEAAPELVEAKRVEAVNSSSDSSAVLHNMLTVAKTLRQVRHVEKTDNPPPDPGRFPPEERVSFNPKKVRIDVTSDYGCPINRKESVNLGEFCTDRDIATEVGKAVGRIQWGRTKGQLFSVDLASLPEYDLHPLNTFSFVFPNGGVEVYALDSPGVVYKNNEAIFTATGLFVGLTGAPGSSIDPSGPSPGFGGEPPIPPPIGSSNPPTLIPLDENNEVDIANLPNNVLVLPPDTDPPPGFVGLVILGPGDIPPSPKENVLILGPGSPPPNNVPNVTVLPGVSPPTSPPVWDIDTSIDPPVAPNYNLGVQVARTESPKPCIDATICSFQVIQNVGNDLEIFCDDFDGCRTNESQLGPDAGLDMHPVIIDRFVLSSGNALITQSVTPTSLSFVGNPSEIQNACIYPICDDIYADPPQEDPDAFAP